MIPSYSYVDIGSCTKKVTIKMYILRERCSNKSFKIYELIMKMNFYLLINGFLLLHIITLILEVRILLFIYYEVKACIRSSHYVALNKVNGTLKQI